MSVENIGLLLIVAYLGWWLYSVINKKQKKEPNSEKIELISGKDGKIIKMIIPTNALVQQKKETLSEEDFLRGAKMTFHVVSNAFAKGRKKELKDFLAPKVYETFVKAIETREAKKNSVDFSLVCLSSAKVLKKAQDLKEVTVEFISEQINLLKNEKGEVIEGDPMTVATVEDVWTFKRKGHNNWIITATKSGVEHA